MPPNLGELILAAARGQENCFQWWCVDLRTLEMQKVGAPTPHLSGKINHGQTLWCAQGEALEVLLNAVRQVAELKAEVEFVSSEYS